MLYRSEIDLISNLSNCGECASVSNQYCKSKSAKLLRNKSIERLDVTANKHDDSGIDCKSVLFVFNVQRQTNKQVEVSNSNQRTSHLHCKIYTTSHRSKIRQLQRAEDLKISDIWIQSERGGNQYWRSETNPMEQTPPPHPTKTMLHIDTLGKPSDAYITHSFGKVRISRSNVPTSNAK